MHYCGVVAMQGSLQLAMLEEVRTPEPPIRLSALFYEPGSAADVARELLTLEEVVIGVGAPLAGPRNGRPGRDCDALLLRRGVAPLAATQETRLLADLLRDLPTFAPEGDGHTGAVEEGAYGRFPAVRDQRRRRLLRAPGPAAAGQAPPVRAAQADRGARRRPRHRRRRRPVAPAHRGDRRDRLRALRAPLRRRARELAGRPEEGVVVLPGASIPSEFTRQGVIPPVERLHLSRA